MNLESLLDALNSLLQTMSHLPSRSRRSSPTKRQRMLQRWMPSFPPLPLQKLSFKGWCRSGRVQSRQSFRHFCRLKGVHDATEGMFYCGHVGNPGTGFKAQSNSRFRLGFNWQFQNSADSSRRAAKPYGSLAVAGPSTINVNTTRIR